MTYETSPIDRHLAREHMRKVFTSFEFDARRIALSLPLEEQLAMSIPLEHLRRLLWPEVRSYPNVHPILRKRMERK